MNRLVPVRKGSRFPDLTAPSGTGESRAEAQRRGGVFELLGIPKGVLLQVSPPGNCCRCVRPLVRIGVGVGIGIDSCSGWRLALMDRSNFAAAMCQNRNNTVAYPVACLRIPARVHSIPIAIATPTPIIDLFGRPQARSRNVHDDAASTSGCRSVSSLSKSKSKSKSGSGSIPALVGAWPSWTAQASLPRCVSTATIRLRHPVFRVRIPSRVHSIPIAIATPTPILLYR